MMDDSKTESKFVSKINFVSQRRPRDSETEIEDGSSEKKVDENESGTPNEQGEDHYLYTGISDFKVRSIPQSSRYGSCRDVNEFEKLNRVGEGTYGIVYRARDSKSGAIVALKKVRMEMEKHTGQ